MRWQQVLKLLHHYVNAFMIPRLLVWLINIECEECKVRVVPHQPSLPEHLNLQLCIPIDKQPDPDPFGTR